MSPWRWTRRTSRCCVTGASAIRRSRAPVASRCRRRWSASRPALGEGRARAPASCVLRNLAEAFDFSSRSTPSSSFLRRQLDQLALRLREGMRVVALTLPLEGARCGVSSRFPRRPATKRHSVYTSKVSGSSSSRRGAVAHPFSDSQQFQLRGRCRPSFWRNLAASGARRRTRSASLKTPRRTARLSRRSLKNGHARNRAARAHGLPLQRAHRPGAGPPAALYAGHGFSEKACGEIVTHRAVSAPGSWWDRETWTVEE
jgi:hypothetical protein